MNTKIIKMTSNNSTPWTCADKLTCTLLPWLSPKDRSMGLNMVVHNFLVHFDSLCGCVCERERLHLDHFCELIYEPEAGWQSMAMVQVLVPRVKGGPIGWTIMIECTSKHAIHLMSLSLRRAILLKALPIFVMPVSGLHIDLDQLEVETIKYFTLVATS